MAQGHMTEKEREAFLADVHVGILAIDEPGRGPCALPIWYVYDDGVVHINIDGRSLKARLLQDVDRATLTIQTETAPYKYASIEGPVRVEQGEYDGFAMASRYLGDDLGRWYVDNNPHTDDSMIVRLTPEHWRTFDFGKLFE